MSLEGLQYDCYGIKWDCNTIAMGCSRAYYVETITTIAVGLPRAYYVVTTRLDPDPDPNPNPNTVVKLLSSAVLQSSEYSHSASEYCYSARMSCRAVSRVGLHESSWTAVRLLWDCHLPTMW